MVSMNYLLKYLTLASLLMLFGCHKSNETLRLKIQGIISKTDAKFGVGIKNLDTDDTLNINNGEQYPMQSVYKFPLAMAVLNQIDKGKLSLDQKIHITKNDLLSNTWSPLSDKYPDGNVDLPLSEILCYTVSQSDNNGCDILFRLIGGTCKADSFIHSLGIKCIMIKGTEEEMHKDWNVQFTNWCKPKAMVQLLNIFYQKKVLSETSNNFLWKQMVETTTGPKRIKGLLPSETIVAHKTGSSGKNENGLTAALNDVGIIVLPNGQHIAIAIFVSNTKADDATNEKAMAEIAKAVYDFYQ